MLDMERLAKVLALADSDIDGEALAAIRKAKKLLHAANMSFTDIAQSLGSGGKAGGDSTEIDRLQVTITRLHVRLADAEQEIDRLRSRQSRSHPSNLRRTRADIEATLRAVFKDEPNLSDREFARRIGLSPKTVGIWRRKIEAERASRRRTVHNGRKRAA
jgi:hypothetical protein